MTRVSWSDGSCVPACGFHTPSSTAKDPAATGVPRIAPAESTVTPCGSVPLASHHEFWVSGAPVVWSETLTGTPTSAAGAAVKTVIENGHCESPPHEPCTPSQKLQRPGVDGVPKTTPAGVSDKPGGNGASPDMWKV